MARIAKSKDTANWRKGNAISKGDVIAVGWNPDGTVAITSRVTEISTGLYMSRRGYVFTTECGKVKHAASAEYVEGRYAVPAAGLRDGFDSDFEAAMRGE